MLSTDLPFHPPVFTLLMLILISSFAALTKTTEGRLPAEWLGHLGFAPEDLLIRKFEKIFLSVFVTDSRKSFIQALCMIVFCVGGLEILTSSWVTMLYFWVIHTLTLMIVTLLIVNPFKRAGHFLGKALYLCKDVGPSAGYFGCLGVLIHSLPPKFGILIFGLIFCGMLIYLKMPARENDDRLMKLHADLAHLVAFSLGFAVYLKFVFR